STDSGNNSNWAFSNACPVEVTTAPESQVGCPGGPVSFSVAASGSGLSFQWRRNGVNLSDGGNVFGATTDTLTINPTAPADVASYDVVVTNSFGVTATSAEASLTLLSQTQISSQPSSAIRCEGESVTFSVIASGTNISFQWRKGGVNIPAATANSFTIDPLAATDSGSYDVVVTGTCGIVTSDTASLAVNTAPSITSQPADQTVCSGSIASFSAAADAMPAAGLQWQVSTDSGASFNDIAGAITSPLSFIASGEQEGNRYRAVFTNICGTATSSEATLTVNLFTLSRAHRSFAGAGGADSIDVAVAAGCGWTAASDQNWITITGGSPGNGNGTVSYTIEANPDSTVRSGTITIGDQTFRIFQGRDFADVQAGHVFYTEIGKLSARGVTLGCDSSNYCPDLTVTRQQMAAFIIRALGDFNPPPPAMQRFSDVPPSNPFYAFIEQMAVRQITLGCGGGNYCPTDPVLRDQMAAFIIRALHEPGYIPPVPAMQRFPDVPPANAFYAHIEEMAVRQITLGCGGGNYCPSLEVSRGQMAAFLVRAFDL
ncbi:MAG TPA: S-layer homology domain-containing protein, partial [Blastocatellia bacterium]|nr:S-layer homology domain-containing protein [Blastocatellia bacterium]